MKRQCDRTLGGAPAQAAAAADRDGAAAGGGRAGRGGGAADPMTAAAPCHQYNYFHAGLVSLSVYFIFLRALSA